MKISSICKPKNFEIFLEKLWSDMAEKFLLKYNPIEEKNKVENETAVEDEILEEEMEDPNEGL